MSHAIHHTRKRLEDLLCDSEHCRTACSCSKLKALYGLRLFRCDRIFCPHYVDGFETRRARDTHIAEHSRPFRCNELECAFAELGFRCERDRARHEITTHEQPNQFGSFKVYEALDVASINKDFEAMVQDAILNEEINIVQYLLNRESCPYKPEEEDD
jgi:hypothetical protein